MQNELGKKESESPKDITGDITDKKPVEDSKSLLKLLSFFGLLLFGGAGGATIAWGFGSLILFFSNRELAFSIVSMLSCLICGAICGAIGAVIGIINDYKNGVLKDKWYYNVEVIRSGLFFGGFVGGVIGLLLVILGVIT